MAVQVSLVVGWPGFYKEINCGTFLYFVFFVFLFFSSMLILGGKHQKIIECGEMLDALEKHAGEDLFCVFGFKKWQPMQTYVTIEKK